MGAQQPEDIMNKAAVYVFRDAQCMKFGFTMLSRYFKTMEEANKYAQGFSFAKVVDFVNTDNRDSDDESKRRGGAW
jgi:hypothetical protein